MSEWTKDNPLREEAERLRKVGSMTTQPQWAIDKAREWLLAHHWVRESAEQLAPSLAALLAQVEQNTTKGMYEVMVEKEEAGLDLVQASTRQRVLAEVRRVVNEVAGPGGMWGERPRACDEILARLEKM